ncbi:alcohol dehydrogenase catalytic domain-containing protein [Candidatus Woesearchaeota archaeon]|nr:alcohol dehydrogenase catalytic domain-containing protein [Candidatus Woesearchaeota archaeon]
METDRMMDAAVLEGVGKLALSKVPVPETGDYDILIRVDSCGICGSDLRILKTGNKRIKYPEIVGHEIAGTVVKIGSNQKDRFRIGDRIALSADIPCGHCEMCKDGISNQCLNRIAFGHEYPGGFAEYLKLDKRIIDFGPMVVVPETATTSQDELTLCEPLACCINGIEKSGLEMGDSVLIFGAGPVGCILAKLCKALGASRVVLSDVDDVRLNAAKVAEADGYLTPSELDNAWQDITDNRGFNLIITACPAKAAQEAALKYSKKRGTILLFGGLPENDQHVTLNTNIIHYKELSVVGSHASTPAQHRKAVELVTTGRVDLRNLISRRYPLSRILEAYEDSEKDRSNLKIIINPHSKTDRNTSTYMGRETVR